MKRVAVIVCLSIAFLSACGSQPVEKRKYTLHPSTMESGVQKPATIALRKIELAPYLRHEGIVIETETGEVKNAKHSLWAESLSYSVRRYLQVQLRQSTGLPVAMHATKNDNVTHNIDVLIHQLHGTETGTVMLVASSKVHNTGSEEAPVEMEFIATEKLTADGYPAVVHAHKLLLNALAENIATAISED